MIRAQSTEEMRADLELVNLGKENLGGEEEGSPLFKRPSSLCVKTPVSLAPAPTSLLTNPTGKDSHGRLHFNPSLQGGQGKGSGEKSREKVC